MGKNKTIVAVCFFLLIGNLSVYAETLRFQMTLTYNAIPLSAILILKSEDVLCKGVIINEFGINLIEFTANKGKAKIVRLHPILKKPFLKKVLKNDFELIIESISSASNRIIRSKKRGIFHAYCYKREDEDNNLLSLQLEHKKLSLTIILNTF